MADIKSRLRRLEKAAQPDGPPRILIFWQDDTQRRDNGDGTVTDLRTGETFRPTRIIHLEWADSGSVFDEQN